MSAVTPLRVVLLSMLGSCLTIIIFFILLNNTQHSLQHSLDSIISDLGDVHNKLDEAASEAHKIESTVNTKLQPKMKVPRKNPAVDATNAVGDKLSGTMNSIKNEFKADIEQLHSAIKRASEVATEAASASKATSTRCEAATKTCQTAAAKSSSGSGSSGSPATTTTEKRVISFGLYGSDPKYTFGAIRNTELAKIIFPDWVCRFYIDGSVPADVVAKLRENGAEIVEITDITGGIAGMFWRFLVADDPTVDRYIIRDADSRLNLREKMAIEEWIASGKGVHILRDHPNHNYVMNGGMWGAVKGAIPNMRSMMTSWNDKSNYIADMNFLGALVYPKIESNVIAHDSFHCERYTNSHPFPTRRFGWEHVGQVFDARDVAREGDIPFISNRPGNPEKCRKKPEYTYG